MLASNKKLSYARIWEQPIVALNKKQNKTVAKLYRWLLDYTQLTKIKAYLSQRKIVLVDKLWLYWRFHNYLNFHTTRKKFSSKNLLKHTHKHTLSHRHTYTYIHIYTNIYIYMYILYIYTYINKHIYKYIYIYTMYYIYLWCT